MRTLAPETRVPPPTAARGHSAAVVALTTIAVGLWAARSAWTGDTTYAWLLWNLALAWVPWLAARALRSARAPAALAAAAVTWLLFLPNAPYLLTDLVHLRARPPVPLWFDVLFFAAFALAGCALGWAAVAAVHARLAGALGPGRAFVVIALLHPLIGFGVYLGRFDRWNSWDLFTRPGALLGGAVEALGEPKALVFSVAFGVLIGAGYLLLAPPPPAAAPADPPAA